jgi:RNA polymerase sigma-70 factor (ECF subfamily)
VAAVNDKQIIALYWQRNENAIHETSVQYGSYCYAIANKILLNNEDSEECVNDTWLKAWHAIPPQRPVHLKMFLAKITRNLSFDKYKAGKAAKRGNGEITAVLDELSECIPSSSDVEAELQSKELEKQINRFLHSLGKRDRDVFLRRYFYVETIPVIAQRYGLKDDNVMMILSRTRHKLKNQLEQEDYII